LLLRDYAAFAGKKYPVAVFTLACNVTVGRHDKTLQQQHVTLCTPTHRTRGLPSVKMALRFVFKS
jgi:hypothetical protein